MNGDIVKDSDYTGGIVKFSVEEVASCGCCVPSFSGVGFVAELPHNKGRMEIEFG